MNGFIALGDNTGILEWSGDDHIRLFDIEPTTGQVRSVVFDTELTGIRKVTGMASSMTIHLSNTKYTFNFSSASTISLSLGLIGMFASHKLNEASGIYNWTNGFKASGVVVRVLTYKAMIGIGLAAGVGLVLLITIGGFAIYMLGQ